MEQEFDAMRRLIRAYGYNGVTLGKLLAMSPQTARLKIREPWRFTLEDIRRLHTDGCIPLDKIRAAIT